MMFLSLTSRFESFLDLASEASKTVRKEAREYSYMLRMAESESMTKKRTAPLLAAGVYLDLTTSISSAVSLAFSSFSAISMALSLVSSKVWMSSSLSKMLPVALLSSCKRVSSSFFSKALFWDMSLISSSLLSSKSRRSCLTVTFRSCAWRPCWVTL